MVQCDKCWEVMDEIQREIQHPRMLAAPPFVFHMFECSVCDWITADDHQRTQNARMLASITQGM